MKNLKVLIFPYQEILFPNNYKITLLDKKRGLNKSVLRINETFDIIIGDIRDITPNGMYYKKAKDKYPTLKDYEIVLLKLIDLLNDKGFMKIKVPDIFDENNLMSEELLNEFKRYGSLNLKENELHFIKGTARNNHIKEIINKIKDIKNKDIKKQLDEKLKEWDNINDSLYYNLENEKNVIYNTENVFKTNIKTESNSNPNMPEEDIKFNNIKNKQIDKETQKPKRRKRGRPPKNRKD